MSSNIVLSPAQLECLASPACSGVFVALRSLGQATAKEIAVKTNRSPATVLYHLGRLEKADLVKIIDRRAAVRKPEAVFAATADRFDLPRDIGSRRLKTRAVQASLRRAIRGWERAAEAERSPMHIVAAQFRLSTDDAEEFTRLLDAAAAFARERESAEGVQFHWVAALFPEADC